VDDDIESVHWIRFPIHPLYHTRCFVVLCILLLADASQEIDPDGTNPPPPPPHNHHPHRVESEDGGKRIVLNVPPPTKKRHNMRYHSEQTKIVEDSMIEKRSACGFPSNNIREMQRPIKHPTRVEEEDTSDTTDAVTKLEMVGCRIWFVHAQLG